jgi:hypothetical protein
MLDTQEYTIEADDHQGKGNGYDQLQGDWGLYYKVAKGFVHRVKPEDAQDFLHSLLLTMAKVKAKYDATGKPLTEAGLIRVASYEVADYWRKQFQRINGHHCGQCGQTQRRECKESDRRDCPKTVKIEILEKLVVDSEGNQTELCNMIADDEAIDVVARLDARFILQSYPHRFVRLAYKKYAGLPLSNEERVYFCRQRNKARKIFQKRLAIV